MIDYSDLSCYKLSEADIDFIDNGFLNDDELAETDLNN